MLLLSVSALQFTQRMAQAEAGENMGLPPKIPATVHMHDASF